MKCNEKQIIPSFFLYLMPDFHMASMYYSSGSCWSKKIKLKVESKTMDSVAGNCCRCCSHCLQMLPQVITWWISAVLQTDELFLCLLLQLVSFIQSAV